MKVRWGIHNLMKEFGVSNLIVLAKYSFRISCIPDPYVQISVQAKLLDKEGHRVTQQALFSLDVQSLISY